MKSTSNSDPFVFLGYYSDIGCALAYQYASRGAHICLVGSRDIVGLVRDKCEAIFEREYPRNLKKADSILCVTPNNDKGVEVSHLHRKIVTGTLLFDPIVPQCPSSSLEHPKLGED